MRLVAISERRASYISMKRHGHLWDKLVDHENLRLAIKNASRGKRWQRKVKKVLAREDECVQELHNMLISGQYHTAKYKTKVIYEPKQRTIFILPFYPDRIVHHAIMQVLEPIWDGLLISDSYACRIGKGQHAGSRRCMQWTRQFKYCLKCDVSKFYPSLDHEVLRKIIRKKLKDPFLLNLLDEIIGSVPNGKNVPIGNYLSQWFGNIYLNELDTFIKQEKRIKPYLRYCDDFVIFSNDKSELHALAGEIKDFLGSKLLLRLSKCEVFPVTQGIDFLGYRHFPQGYILVRKSTAKRVKKRMSVVLHELESGRLTVERATAKVASTEGWLKHANTRHFSLSLKLAEIKKEIANHEKVQ